MEFTAKLGTIRVTPRKMGMIADEIRGKGINDALTYLRFSPRKRVARAFEVLLRSAIANADQKGTVDVDQLVLKRVLVGQGPILKRFRPRAKGSAFRILKRTSKITVTLAEK